MRAWAATDCYTGWTFAWMKEVGLCGFYDGLDLYCWSSNSGFDLDLKHLRNMNGYLLPWRMKP